MSEEIKHELERLQIEIAVEFRRGRAQHYGGMVDAFAEQLSVWPEEVRLIERGKMDPDFSLKRIVALLYAVGCRLRVERIQEQLNLDNPEPGASESVREVVSPRAADEGT
jgi:hypothetical protein